MKVYSPNTHGMMGERKFMFMGSKDDDIHHLTSFNKIAT